MLPEVIMLTMKRIRIRRIVRRITDKDALMRNAHAHAQGYLKEYPWLADLIPLGSNIYVQKGIRFEPLSPQDVFGSGSGRVYLVDKFGQVLSGVGWPWFSALHRLYCQLHKAVRRLRVNQAYVRYIVQVRRCATSYTSSTTIIRIHRVEKGIDLASWVEGMHRLGIDQFQESLEQKRRAEDAARQLELQRGQNEARAQGV
jgi:hypothetical protein